MHTWTYQDARANFLRWIAPQVSHLESPRERIEALVRALGRIINLSEDARVRQWAEVLWCELVDLDLPGESA